MPGTNGFDRQLDAERRAAGFDALDVDRAAVRLHDRLADREAETRALDCGLRRDARAEELVEEPLLVLRADPDARVPHLEPDRAGVRARDDLDLASRERELDRVREQVVEQLCEAAAVAR